MFSVQFSHEAHDPTNPVVYFHFDEDQGWTNHGAQIVMEQTPFARVSFFMNVGMFALKTTSNQISEPLISRVRKPMSERISVVLSYQTTHLVLQEFSAFE